MKAFNEKIVLRNVAIDPGAGGKDLIAAINTPVTVFFTGTTNKPDLFDLAGAPIANPVDTDIKGNVVFKVADGVYDIVGASGTDNETRWDEVEIIDLVTAGLRPDYDTVAAMKADLGLGAGLSGSDTVATDTKDYRSSNRGGGAPYLIKTPAQAATDGDVIDESVNHTLDNAKVAVIQHQGFILDTQSGVTNDGVTDDGPATNAGIQWVRNSLSHIKVFRVTSGQKSIEEPIKLLQAVDVVGPGTLSGNVGGAEYICNFSAGTIATPPTDNFAGSRFSPTLLFTPMMYNTELLTQANIGGFRLNGNDKDVYGMYLNEWFYMNFLPMFIIQCNKNPITAIVGQFNYFKLLACTNNKAGPRFIGCDTVVIDGLDTEGTDTAGSALDIVQDISTKSSFTINEWHYEETATVFPDILAQLSGRNIKVNGSSFGMSGVPPLRFIELFGGTETYNFDGESFTVIAAINTEIERHSFSAVTGAFQLNGGVTGADIVTNAGGAHIDNSGNVTNIIRGFTAAQELPRGTRVLNSTGGFMMEFPDDLSVNFFNNANRSFTASAANWVMANLAGRIDINASNSVFMDVGTGVFDIDAGGGNAGRFDGDSTAGNTRLLVFDVDNNTLERVTVGAADSGGVGFKVLRIPN